MIKLIFERQLTWAVTVSTASHAFDRTNTTSRLPTKVITKEFQGQVGHDLINLSNSRPFYFAFKPCQSNLTFKFLLKAARSFSAIKTLPKLVREQQNKLSETFLNRNDNRKQNKINHRSNEFH